MQTKIWSWTHGPNIRRNHDPYSWFISRELQWWFRISTAIESSSASLQGHSSCIVQHPGTTHRNTVVHLETAYPKRGPPTCHPWSESRYEELETWSFSLELGGNTPRKTAEKCALRKEWFFFRAVITNRDMEASWIQHQKSSGAPGGTCFCWPSWYVWRGW